MKLISLNGSEYALNMRWEDHMRIFVLYAVLLRGRSGLLATAAVTQARSESPSDSQLVALSDVDERG